MILNVTLVKKGHMLKIFDQFPEIFFKIVRPIDLRSGMRHHLGETPRAFQFQMAFLNI